MTAIPSEHDDPGITAILRRIENKRDEDACDRLWQAYFERVIRIVRQRLSPLSSRDASEDDVALSAMKSFYRAAENGALASINDRDGLWKFLAMLAARKARAANRRNMTECRGAGNVVVFTDLQEALAGKQKAERPEAVDLATDAAFIGQLLLESAERLKSLPSQRLQRIAALRMEGYELEEIAKLVGMSRSAVSNKLKLIRDLWTYAARDVPD